MHWLTFIGSSILNLKFQSTKNFLNLNEWFTLFLNFFIIEIVKKYLIKWLVKVGYGSPILPISLVLIDSLQKFNFLVLVLGLDQSRHQFSDNWLVWFGFWSYWIIIGFWNRTHFKRVWMTNIWKVLFIYDHNSTYSLKNHLLMIYFVAHSPTGASREKKERK